MSRRRFVIGNSIIQILHFFSEIGESSHFIFNILRISGEQRRKRGESETSAKRELRARGGALKIPPVRVPLFELFWRSNMNAATQLVTFHHVILERLSKKYYDHVHGVI